MFQKATKRAVRARIAIDGPSGSGKTWTGLIWATTLGKKIAMVDTERGSASLYADHFDFDVAEMSPPFHPDRLVAAIHDAEKAGYEVMVIDSLSHFWEGEGGTLELVDAAAARANGNTWAGWKSGTPILRHLIDTILATDMHIVATMRSKTEWVLEKKTNQRGEEVNNPKRVGMAPVMRGGVEYEFTLVGDLDLEHRMTITKSRCDALSDLVIQPNRAGEAAETFVAWTNSGEAMADRNDIDALKARMNKIEPSETRVACKRGFADQFGNPDYLIASKLPAADAYVSGWEGTPEPDSPPPGGASTPVPDAGHDETTADPETGEVHAPLASVDGQAQGGKHTRTYTDPQKLHIAAGPKGHKLAETDLRILIRNASGGRTDSANELSEREIRSVHAEMDAIDITPGRLVEIRKTVAEFEAGQVAS